MNSGTIAARIPHTLRVALGAALLALIVRLIAASAVADEELLRPEDAFRYQATATGDTVVVDWNIAPGYYLYRDRMSYASRTPGVTLGKPAFPPGKEKEDEFFGKQVIYHDRASVRIPYTQIAADARQLTLELKVQGCADAGICYPPQTWTTEVALGESAATSGTSAATPAGKNLLQRRDGGSLYDPRALGHRRRLLPLSQQVRIRFDEQGGATGHTCPARRNSETRRDVRRHGGLLPSGRGPGADLARDAGGR
jgi:thiol:disulfide interchange protein